MRKSFTRLFSIFLLLLGLSFQMAYGIVAPINFDGTKSIPTDGNSNAKPADFATKFVVAFDVAPQIINAADKTVVIYKNGVFIKTIVIPSASVQVVGKTLEITHGITSFTAGDVYSVAITDGAIDNLAPGALANGVYDFTIGDYVAPTLLTTPTAYSPNKGAVNVVANLTGGAFSLVIPFDEPVTIPAIPGNKAVYIYKEDGTIVDIIKVATLTVANGLQTATVTIPVAANAIFQENTNYYVVIDAGAFIDFNSYNNKNAFGGLSAKTTWTFSTRDNSAPVISAKSISAISTTSATLNVTLAEAGKYYYLVTLASAADPSVNDVAAGTAVSVAASAVGTNLTASLSSLTGATEYKVWLVTENGVGVKSLTPSSLSFKTVDNTPPSIIARGTLMNTAKATNALYMVFNEQVVGAGTGTLDLRKNSDESYIKQIAASAITSRKITADEVAANTFGSSRTVNDWVTLVDVGALASNVNYYIVFPAGYIKDLAGNSFAGAGAYIVPINKTDWTFTSSDFEMPTVTAAFATPTSLASAITLTFNEQVQKQLSTTTDWTQVIALEQNNTPVAYTVSPAGAANTSVITLTPGASLSSNTTYTVRLRNNAVMDVSSNMNKITDEKVFSLTTGDLDVLTVAYGSSEDAASNVTPLLAGSSLKIKFNKAIKVNTTGSTWVAADATNLKPLITFKKAAVDQAFTLTYDATTFTATLTPSTAFVSGATDYYFTFNGAKVDDVALIAPVALTASGTLTYSVVDYLAPVVTLSKSGDVSSTANPTITFNEDVRLLGGAATIANGTDVTNLVTFKEGSSSGANLSFTATYTNKVITIAPGSPLTVGSTYYYGIGASVKDASNNVAPATFGSFKMIDPVNPPSIVATTYTINGGAQTPVATKLINVTPNSSSNVVVTVTFNDNIKETQSVAPYNTVSLTDGTNTWFANVTPTSVSANTLSVTFATTASLAAAIDAGTECTLTLPGGIVRGSTAYAPATFANFATTTVKFDSKDITAPVVTSANTYDSTTPTPVLSSTAVALNTKLELNLGEKVELGSGNIEIREGSATGTLVQSIAVNSTNVTLNTAGTLATVAKADLVKYNTTYFVVVPAGAFKDDISLNPNAAVNFSFVTLPNAQPSVLTLTPADDSDQLSTAGSLTLGLTFSEEVIKYDPSVGSRKQWFLIKNTGTTTTPGTRASFGPLLDLVGGTDVVVANNYIETASVGISGANVTIATGFTPVAGEKYYVLITPGAFLDKSTGTSVGASVIPGVFGGITLPTTWNFTTANENAGVVTFTYTKRPDGKVAKTSDIVINFSRPIKNGNGTAITDSQIATLFTLTKTAGPGTPGTKAFIGTISADKKTVTILNSSLVTLGEMTELSSYTLSLTGSAIYENGAAISGASDAFTTSDYTAPVVTPTVANFVSDIVFNTTTNKHEATVTFTSTDNSNLAAIYYTIQEGTASTVAPAVSVIKADKTSVVTGTAPAAVTYKFTDLKEETSYVVWAIAVDAAGNESAVNKVVFITDDKTKPVIATLPTSFDANGKLTFVFNEDVAPVAGSVRILDAATMTYLATLDLGRDPSALSDLKRLVTSAFAGLATGNTTVSYYVEIDKGLVADVPVYTGDAVNYFDGLFRTALTVTSKDITAPTVMSSTPSLPATDVDTNFSIKVTFSEPVRKVSTLPASAFVVEKVLPGPTYEPFQVIEPANVVTNGTKDVTINIGRTLSSTTTYRLTLKVNAFEDLAGNAGAVGTVSGLITSKDVVAPAVTFAPAKAATAVALASPITITFAEAIRNLDNSALDSYDLDSLVYFKKGTTPVAFTASLDGTNKIITVVPSSALVADATYTYGFKAKFEDFNNNVIAADAATFSTVTTSPAGQYLSWTPAKASPYASPWTWLGATSPVTLNFTGPIFTWSAVYEENNLPVTAAKAAAAISVTKDGVVIPAANLVFTVDNVTNKISVAPKAGTDWGSQSKIVVTLLPNKLQINEGNIAAMPTDESTYKAEDTVDPIVDATKTTSTFTAGYFPENVGVNGVSPSIAKTESLKLYFSEDVKVGTGTVEIYRWDGVLAKPAMTASVDATDKKLVTLGDLTGIPTNQEYYVIVNPGAVVDVTDSNPYAGLTTVKTWKFLLKDDATPQVVSYLPTTTNVSVSTKLTITFDRPIATAATGYLALYKSVAGGDAVQLYRGSDAPSKFTVSGNTVTVDISTLEAETKYFVELAAGTFVSSVDASKAHDAILRSVWSFTTEVNTAPLAVTYGPVKADPMTVDVPLTSGLTITFDQDVVAGIGNIQLHKKQTFGGPIITNFDVTDPTKVTFDGKSVSISADVLKLENNSEYYVIVPGTAVKNTSLTPEYWAGITVPFAWQFKTFNDVTAPQLLSYTPNAVTLTTEKNHPTLTMTYNENLVFGAGNVKIYKKSDNSLALTIPVTAAMVSGKVVTVTYVAPATGGLDKNTDYYVLTDAGIVKDAVGNGVAAITDVTKWTFKTGDFATGIDTPIDNSLEFKVYPNPFVEYVTVDNASELTKIVISNIAGQIVKEVVTPDSKIQLNELRSGVYFMSLYKGNTVINTVKIAKR